MIAAASTCDPVSGFPVRIVQGTVACATARSTLGAFLRDGSQPDGWFCARGHDEVPFAAQCASTPDGKIVIQALDKPSISAPKTARIGHRVRVSGVGLTSARYSLTLVYELRSARNAACVADIGKPRRSHNGSVVLTGVIPHRLTCYQGLNVKLGTVKTAPGSYHFIVGKKVGPAGWGDASFVRRPVRVTR